MTREDYKKVLLNKGFIFEGTQMGFPGRGEEDKFTLRGYKHKFYVTRIDKEDEDSIGFVTSKSNGKLLEEMCPPNAADNFAESRELYVWIDDGFAELMNKI